MIIGITGATGFIGKALVLECLKHNHQVRILTRTRIKDEISLDNVEVFFGSLTDYHLDLTSFIDGLDLLYHCAGEIHDLYKMEPLHVSGTKRLLALVYTVQLEASRQILELLQRNLMFGQLEYMKRRRQYRTR